METTPTFIEAVKAGDLETIEHMLDGDPALASARTPGGVSAVLVAVYYGKSAVADLLIARGASLDVFEAAATGRVERVRAWLDEQPALANAYAADGFQPLGLASFFGHTPVAELLVERGAEVNSPSRNDQRVQPLHSAAAAQHLEIARLLVEHGADVNAVQAGAFTPLHAAAQNGQVGMIRLLLAHGADLPALSKAGQTALDYALENGHAEAADRLRRA